MLSTFLVGMVLLAFFSSSHFCLSQNRMCGKCKVNTMNNCDFFPVLKAKSHWIALQKCRERKKNDYRPHSPDGSAVSVQ